MVDRIILNREELRRLADFVKTFDQCERFVITQNIDIGSLTCVTTKTKGPVENTSDITDYSRW